MHTTHKDEDATDDAGRLPPGSTFGSYRIVRAVGSGGFGTVYEAERQPLGNRVALKVLHQVSGSSSATARFVREAKAMSLVSHPNLVKVHDLGSHEGNIFIVMDLIEGPTLDSWLSAGGLRKPAEILDLLIPVVSALGRLHVAGIVHRDVKPENIMLVSPRAGALHPILLDLGIAKLTGPADEFSLTASNTTMGTPLFMSPEQTSDVKRVDGRTDQYSLGVTLYLALCGRTPFEGHSFFEIVHAINEAPVPTPSGFSAAISPEFEAVLLRALARNADDRFPTMTAFGRALLLFASPSTRQEWESEFSSDNEGASALALADTGALDDASGALRGLSAGLSTTTEWATKPSPRPAPDRGVFGARRATLALGAIALVAASAVSAVLGARFAQRPPPPLPAVASAPDLIVAVVSDPPGAEISLDGRPVGTGQFRAVLPPGASVHTLRVRAAGFESQSFSFRDTPPPLRVSLDRLPVAPPPTGGAPAPDPPTAAQAVPEDDARPTRPHRHRSRPTAPDSPRPSPPPGGVPVI